MPLRTVHGSQVSFFEAACGEQAVVVRPRPPVRCAEKSPRNATRATLVTLAMLEIFGVLFRCDEWHGARGTPQEGAVNCPLPWGGQVLALSRLTAGGEVMFFGIRALLFWLLVARRESFAPDTLIGVAATTVLAPSHKSEARDHGSFPCPVLPPHRRRRLGTLQGSGVRWPSDELIWLAQTSVCLSSKTQRVP